MRLLPQTTLTANKIQIIIKINLTQTLQTVDKTIRIFLILPKEWSAQ